ncbi:hypothetical protein RI129_010357 [Pyrocoelia pectoralis]|uniref:HMG box domain-containing protein n=1 Tax=Pyrocoelia pectoralis TaxID=417401 RepID=A0AAN7ZD78_9COLE
MSVQALLSNMVLNGRGILINRVITAFQPIITLNSEAHKDAKVVEIPKGPKKPLTTYFQYLVENRSILQKQHPELKQTDVVKKIASNWRNMDIKLKEKYEEIYRKESTAYEEEHSKYLSSLTDEQLKALKKVNADKRVKRNKRVVRKLWRDTSKPKRPLTNFGYFIQEKRELPENKGQKLADLLNKYKEAWNKLSDDGKEKYTQMFKHDQERYHAEIKKWEAKMIEEGKENIIRKDTQIVNPTKIKPQQK